MKTVPCYRIIRPTCRFTHPVAPTGSFCSPLEPASEEDIARYMRASQEAVWLAYAARVADRVERRIAKHAGGAEELYRPR